MNWFLHATPIPMVWHWQLLWCYHSFNAAPSKYSIHFFSLQMGSSVAIIHFKWFLCAASAVFPWILCFYHSFHSFHLFFMGPFMPHQYQWYDIGDSFDVIIHSMLHQLNIPLFFLSLMMGPFAAVIPLKWFLPNINSMKLVPLMLSFLFQMDGIPLIFINTQY